MITLISIKILGGYRLMKNTVLLTQQTSFVSLLKVVEDGYEFFVKRQLVILFSFTPLDHIIPISRYLGHKISLILISLLSTKLTLFCFFIQGCGGWL